MAKIRILVSLTTSDNDYQVEQAQSAEQAASKLGVTAEIIYANNDAINQSTQILRAIQASTEDRPNAIVFEPVGGTALPQVARAAAAADIGWAVLNRDANYIEDLRKTSAAAIFAISSDHAEIGRIQGRQFAAMLPRGGAVLYIQGPSENSAAKERTLGMQETKPANIQIIALRGQWTEESAQRAVRSWLKLPFTGCDGLPKTGQTWVRSGLLAATVFVPPNTGQAIEMFVQAIQQKKPAPERVFTVPTSIPPLSALKPVRIA